MLWFIFTVDFVLIVLSIALKKNVCFVFISYVKIELKKLFSIFHLVATQSKGRKIKSYKKLNIQNWNKLKEVKIKVDIKFLTCQGEMSVLLSDNQPSARLDLQFWVTHTCLASVICTQSTNRFNFHHQSHITTLSLIFKCSNSNKQMYPPVSSS